MAGSAPAGARPILLSGRSNGYSLRLNHEPRPVVSRGDGNLRLREVGVRGGIGTEISGMRWRMASWDREERDPSLAHMGWQEKGRMTQQHSTIHTPACILLKQLQAPIYRSTLMTPTGACVLPLLLTQCVFLARSLTLLCPISDLRLNIPCLTGVLGG